MKANLIALLGGCVLPFAANASTFSDALDRIDIENPEFVLYADVESDFNALGGLLSDAYLSYLMTSPDIPPVPVDFTRLFTNLGLTSLSSVTVASEPFDKGTFRNEALAEFAGSPSGVFLLFGERNQPFSIQDTAPSDADLVAEMNFNGVVFFEMIRNIVIDMMGPMGEGIIDGQMNQPLAEGGPTLAELIQRLTTRVQIAIRPDFGSDIPNSIPKAFLNGKGVVRIDEIADLLDTFGPMLQQAGFAPVEGSDGAAWSMSVENPEMPFTLFLNKISGTNDLAVSVGEESVEWFTGATDTISGTPEFQRFVAPLPREGLSFWYSTERMSVLQIQNLDADFREDPKFQALFANLKDFLLRYTGTQASVSYLEDDAYRTTSIQPASLKSNFGMAAVGLSVGIMAGVVEAMEAQMAAQQQAVETAGEDDASTPE